MSLIAVFLCLMSYLCVYMRFGDSVSQRAGAKSSFNEDETDSCIFLHVHIHLKFVIKKLDQRSDWKLLSGRRQRARHTP